MSLGSQSILRLQWRRSWYDAWSDDKGTVEIGQWKKGAGNQVGSLELASWELSTDMAPENSGREAEGALCPLQIMDFVRVVEVVRTVNKSGAVTYPLSKPLVVHWTGVILSRSRKFTGWQNKTNPGGYLDLRRVTWTVAGLGALLGLVDLRRFWGCLGAAGKVQVLEGRISFTPERTRNRANDAVSEYQIGMRAKTQPWDARAVIEALLLWHLQEPGSTTTGGMPPLSRRFPRWPDFQLAGLTDCLKYEVRDVTASGTVIDPIVALIHPRRGCIFSIEPPAPDADQKGPCTIRVLSLLTNAITVNIPATEGGGTVVLPASDRTTAAVQSALPHRRLEMGAESPPRRLTIAGKQAAVIANWRWSRDPAGAETGQFTRGWPAAQDNDDISDSPKYLDHWRTFQIRPAWDGSLTTGNLANLASVVGSASTIDPLYGAGGLNGARSFTTGESFCGVNGQFLDMIPIPTRAKDASGALVDLEAWITSQTGRTLDYQAPRMRPVAWAHNRTSNTWTLIKVNVAVTGTNTIHLGSSVSDAKKIKAAISSNDVDLVVLLCMVEPLPFQVSYQPPPVPDPAPGLLTLAALPMSADRLRTVNWAEYLWIAQDTNLGLKTDGTPVKTTGAIVVRNDTAILQQTLALTRPIGERAASITIRDTLSLNALPDVGTLLTTIDGGSGIYLPVNYIITSFEANPSPEKETYGCTITCEIPVVDLDAVL